jgi:hypothetical protein
LDTAEQTFDGRAIEQVITASVVTRLTPDNELSRECHQIHVLGDRARALASFSTLSAGHRLVTSYARYFAR